MFFWIQIKKISEEWNSKKLSRNGCMIEHGLSGATPYANTSVITSGNIRHPLALGIFCPFSPMHDQNTMPLSRTCEHCFMYLSFYCEHEPFFLKTSVSKFLTQLYIFRIMNKTTLFVQRIQTQKLCSPPSCEQHSCVRLQVGQKVWETGSRVTAAPVGSPSLHSRSIFLQSLEQELYPLRHWPSCDLPAIVHFVGFRILNP